MTPTSTPDPQPKKRASTAKKAPKRLTLAEARRTGQLTHAQRLRIMMTNDGWPHPSYKMAGTTMRVLPAGAPPVDSADNAHAEVPLPGERPAQPWTEQDQAAEDAADADTMGSAPPHP